MTSLPGPAVPDVIPCPRCDGPLGAPACSRVVSDGSVGICGPCGRDEALRDAMQLAPVSPAEWPISARLATRPVS